MQRNSSYYADREKRHSSLNLFADTYCSVQDSSFCYASKTSKSRGSIYSRERVNSKTRQGINNRFYDFRAEYAESVGFHDDAESCYSRNIAFHRKNKDLQGSLSQTKFQPIPRKKILKRENLKTTKIKELLGNKSLSKSKAKKQFDLFYTGIRKKNDIIKQLETCQPYDVTNRQVTIQLNDSKGLVNAAFIRKEFAKKKYFFN